MPADREPIPADIQRAVLIEAGHRCAVCGESCPLERAHIVPWSVVRTHCVDNLICLCANCHGRADKEKWGHKTLEYYKKHPWVMRRTLLDGDIKAGVDADRAEEAAREASEARKLSGRFPNLQHQVLNLLHGFYRRDPQAVFPADELAKELKLNPDDLDAVLQDLRSSGHIVGMKHPNHPGVLVKLTPQGVDFSTTNPAEQSDAPKSRSRAV